MDYHRIKNTVVRTLKPRLEGEEAEAMLELVASAVAEGLRDYDQQKQAEELYRSRQ